ncbi:MAG: PilX N-terminal domain-containing pilus assembly protein [Methylomonas sp.]|jgi:type IV pilus assembly protein PilX|uniref:pilus assembly PilX family protein n=1 Tax=Methylomonas sp. TaxID=418 RepID=UPI0025E42929|nr:PilX N-terminal domain-containing pilus assembly protein [Methylomonas sp.]MCK9604950.1 PilX N-terminal domain-containing pilus assembly protein [Methylomonas sp.]
MRINSSAQSGVVLVVGLIMLLLLTIIGVAGVQSTSLEEKMAGNNRDRNLAFQSAEAALRAGEARIETLWNGGNGSIQAFCTGTAGQFSTVPGCNNAPPDPKAAATWTDNTKSITHDTGSSMVGTQPRYFITYVTAYNPGPPATPISFTVTARGTGGQDTTEVILQSHFGGDSAFLP